MTQAAANQPAPRQWTYNQRTGQLRSPDGELHPKRGYSGRHEPQYRNNPAAEDQAEKGPIPRGAYTIGGDTRGCGPLTLILEPDGHNAHERIDLRIHGDSIDNPGKASEGCIILSRIQRDAIHKSRDRRLMVVDEPEWQQ